MSGELLLSNSSGCFQTMDVVLAGETLARLHEMVADGRGRIEVKRGGCDDVCVLISKTELESLEQALEILCGSSDYQSMCDQLTQLAAATGNYAAAAAAE